MERVQNLTQAYSQAPWRKQMQVIGLFLLGLVFIALVASAYLTVTATSASIGRDIQDMNGEIRLIQRENVNLQAQLAVLSSSAVMEKRARDLDFRPIESGETVFMLVPEFTGRQALVLAPAPGNKVTGAPSLPPEYTESLVDWLRRELAQVSFTLLEIK
jgi:cell division protein FtsB